MILIVLLLTVLMISVIYYDARYYIIPNWLNLTIIFAYAALIWVQLPEPWWSGPAAMGAMLAVGLVLFALGIMGGGDVKLITALMLWTGWSMASVMFLLYFSVLGGVLAIAVIMMRAIARAGWQHRVDTDTLPRILKRRQPIPYGIAIAVAFLILLHTNQIPNVPLS